MLDERDAAHRCVVGVEQSDHRAKIVRDCPDDGTVEQGTDPACLESAAVGRLVDHDREVSGEGRSRPRVQEASALALHGGDWDVLAPLENESERAVALGLFACGRDGGESHQDNGGAGGQGGGPHPPRDEVDDGADQDRRDGERLPHHALECVGCARQRMIWTEDGAR